MWGKKMTGDTLVKVQRHLKKFHVLNRKPIIMLDKDTGEELIIFESIRAAGDHVNSKSMSHISKCASGKYDLAYGYKWKFKEDK